MSVKARIEASKPGGGVEMNKRRRRKFPTCGSIGHEPFWGRCPKRKGKRINGSREKHRKVEKLDNVSREQLSL